MRVLVHARKEQQVIAEEQQALLMADPSSPMSAKARMRPGPDDAIGAGCARASNSRPRRLLLATLRAFLWLVFISCVACFVVITWLRPTTWYSTNQDFVNMRNNMTIPFPGDVPVATTTQVKNGKNVTVNVGKDTPLWAGASAFPVTLQVGSVMIAALAIAALKYIQAVEKTSHEQVTPSPSLRSRVLRKVRMVLSHPLPPARVWNAWCGGMTVLDALLVLTWCFMTFTYLYYHITRAFANTAKSLTPPPAPPPRLSPPPPLGNATSNATHSGASPPPATNLITPLFMSRRFEQTAKILGETTRFQMMLMFIPVSRSHFLKWACGTDFPTIIKYHRWMSWGTIWTVLAHSVMYMVLWGAEGSLTEDLTWETTSGRRNIMGLVSSISAVLMAFTSTSWFRRTYYWLFYKMHVIGFLVFTIFAFMHYKGLVNWVLPGLFLYGVDRAFRYWQLATNWTCITFHDFSVNGNVLTLRLTMEKGTSISSKPPMPGQTVYLRCPSISLFQSHPFSVADVASETASNRLYLTLHLAVKGPWTSALRTRLLSGESVSLQVEGPYETTLDNPPTTQVVVMVAGGLGATPMLGLLYQYYRRMADGIKHSGPQKVYLLWSSRRLADFKVLGSELLSAATGVPSALPSPTVCKANVTLGDSRPSDDSNPTPTHKPPKTPLHTAASDASDVLSGCDSADLSAPHSGSWLHASLHYTGYELEQKAQSVKVDMPTPATKTTDTSTASAAIPKPLRSHPALSPALYSLCILAGFFGAWAGLLGANYYDGYYSRTTAQGANYLAVGALQWSLIALGAVCTPLIVLTLHSLVYRCFSFPTAASYVDTGAHTGAFASLQRTLTVLPGYVLAPTQEAQGCSPSTHMALSRGRRDILAELRQVKRDHADLHEVEVLVGGGDELCQATQAACAACNMDTKTPGPVLVYRRVAHHW